jgi:hypothetical protein
MKTLATWRRPALGMLSLAIAACTMDAGTKQTGEGDGGEASVDSTGGIHSGGSSGASLRTGGTSATPVGGSSVGGGRATGGIGSGPRTCNCSCFCGSCSGSTTSGPTTKNCAAGDASCVDCSAACRAFCTSLSCSLMTLASGACS